MTTRIIFCLVAMAVGGCASTTLQELAFKSYSLDTTVTKPIGEPFLIDQDGTMKIEKKWVGLFNSSNGWAVDTTFSSEFLRKELIYSGRSGSTIEISYREFRGNLAAPAFYQNVKYDLSNSAMIRFQNFLIEVLQATNAEITIKVVSDGGTSSNEIRSGANLGDERRRVADFLPSLTSIMVFWGALQISNGGF